MNWFKGIGLEILGLGKCRFGGVNYRWGAVYRVKGKKKHAII